MTKGTKSFGKKHHKSHTCCPRCGKKSFHLVKKRCASCAFPHPKMRKYNFLAKAKRRRTTGTGSCRHLRKIWAMQRNNHTEVNKGEGKSKFFAKKKVKKEAPKPEVVQEKKN
eukprot:EC823868.1.p1 GENE.EC823868.1~~EC823868.1.p1  ORF type:complete len:112 (+),score=53.06 EC823868.1:15-350(+)